MLNQHSNKLSRARRNVNISAALGAALLALLAVPAQASSLVKEDISVVIPAAQLESASDIASVYDTLSAAAEKACFRTQVQTLEERRFSKLCYADLMEDFVASAGVDRLELYHEKMQDS